MKRKLTIALAAAAVLSMAISACSSSSGPSGDNSSGAAKAGGNLIFARSSDIVTLDPTKMTDNASAGTIQQIFDTLYKVAPDGKSLLPSLATKYTLSSNKLTWTFTLRSGVKFSNGKPFTSADVKYTYERVAGTKSNPFASTDAVMKSITTPNPHTVVITTAKPWAPLLSDLALPANSIVPNNLNGESSQKFFAHPVGTGPFEFDYWKKGQEVKLVKNPNYWVTGEPHLDSVTFTVVSDDNTRKLQLQGGQIQVDENPPFSQIAQLNATTGITATLYKSTRTDYILFNFDKKPFDNVHVRRAISYAVDRKALLKAVLYGNGQVANSILSNSFWAYDKNTAGIQFDLAKAKQELAKSPVPHGFRTTLMVGSGDEFEQTMGQIVQQELARIGIKVTLKPVDPSNEYSLTEQGQYDLAFQWDSSDIADPDELVTFSAMGGSTGQHTKAFWTNYNNPQVDSWAEQAEVTFDQTERQTLYTKLQNQTAADAPMVFLFYTPNAYAYSTKLHGFTVTAMGVYPLAQVSLG